MTIDSEERWVDLADFPGYALSDWGNVFNIRNQTPVKPHANSRGLAMVGFMLNGVQRKRSLALLVASIFLPAPRSESFDTPINLDGDRMNNRFSNLAWRPLWFARKYGVQFTDGHPTCETPIEDVETGEKYQSSMAASVHNGVLDFDIYLSMINNTYVFPTGQVFRHAISR